ncbi:FixH family protein [Phocicoccus pinnipedialis]|uniref:YtkA-like domain-containing protein n=1 Tax=Phocicoccus pinnipedialis TaxID=110845 RepID=A0A6V7R0H5_9BACL|nr:FixH family protein [Jeotgalicoccus pinnipedialis]MBP1938764.1 plastocyanin [Jeotgalicoccus pinnipedialis]CAD2070705.1 hypothetical protein JEOPIN946_00074 [Jeotgalicoccus pinnipedialis]
MKRILTLLMTTLIAVTMAACGNSEAEDHAMHENTDEVHPLEVELTVPTEVTAGEKVQFKAHVFMDGEALEADSMMFEVKKGEESLAMIDGEYKDNGDYTIDYTFEETGTYEVIAHTDAMHQHTMPIEAVTVK